MASPLTYDTATGRAASVLVVVSMRVSLTDRQGKVLYQNPAYLFREQYEVSQDLASFFEEDSPAFRRLSQDFARTLVSNVLEGFYVRRIWIFAALLILTGCYSSSRPS